MIEHSTLQPSSTLFAGAAMLAIVIVLGSTVTIALLLRRIAKPQKGQQLVSAAATPAKKKSNRTKRVVTVAEAAPLAAAPPQKIVMTARVLGYGSGGTVVYEGSLEGRRIAVKRMLKAFFDVAERETQVKTITTLVCGCCVCIC